MILNRALEISACANNDEKSERYIKCEIVNNAIIVIIFIECFIGMQIQVH